MYDIAATSAVAAAAKPSLSAIECGKKGAVHAVTAPGLLHAAVVAATARRRRQCRVRDSPFASLLLDEEPDDDDAKSPSHVGAICIRIAQKFKLSKWSLFLLILNFFKF